MLFAARSVLPLRLVPAKFSLFVVALAALLLPAVSRAQTTFTCSSESGTNCALSVGATQTTASKSTFSVPTAGTIQSISVELHGVWSNGTTGTSMNSAEFLLTGPGGSFDILGQTGDTVDGADDTNNSSDPDNGLHGLNIVIEDAASNAAPMNCGDQCSTGETNAWPEGNGSSVGNAGTITDTVKPNSYSGYNPSTKADPPILGVLGEWPATDGCSPDPIIGNSGSYNNAAFCSAPTLTSTYQTTTANGPWTLTLQNLAAYPTAISITDWSLTITYASAISTTTTIGSNGNPSNAANTVTFTATVTATGSTPTGTVTFMANSAAIAGCSGVALSGGQAHCTASLGQGNNIVEASYAPSSGYGASNATMTQLVEVTPTQSGNTWCNSSSIAQPANGTPVAYPAMVHVSGYPNGTTVGNVTVLLNGASGTSGISNEFLLVAPGGGAHNLDFLDFAFNEQSVSNVNLTISDTGTLENKSEASSGTYLPYDGDTLNNNGGFPSSPAPETDSNIPQVPGTINDAQSVGTYTLEQAFSGSPANGDWALYLTGEAPVTLSGGWCVDLTINAGSATTTSVASNNPHASFGQSVQFTATVSSGSTVNEGTVTFVDTTTSATLASGVPVSNGQASFSTSALAEGDHKITATYNGTTNFDTSFGSVEQRVDRTTVVTNQGGDTWNFCNPGAVQIQENASGAYTPNPSNVFVTGFPGTFESAAVILNGFSVTAANPYETESLIEGPGSTHPALDFFSNTGGVGNEDIASGTYTFMDGASGLVPDAGNNIEPGIYDPTAYAYDPGGSEPFTSSYFYPAPSSYSLAAPAGDSQNGGAGTFASVFPNTLSPNGTWSLFFNQHYPENAQADGAANGWCMQLTGTPPAVSVSASHDGSTFAQSQQGAEIVVQIKNNGAGSTGDPSGGSYPMTVTDTLNSAFTYVSGSGTNWTCTNSSQTVTCTNDSAIADGDSYPDLTINVNVSSTATGTVTNSVTASGAGVASTASNSDSITILPPPSLSVTKTHTGTFTQGQTAQWTITVSNGSGDAATSGAINVADTLPNGYTLASYTSTGSAWSCSGAGTGTVACNSTTAIAGGSSSAITLTVSVPAASATSVSNTASAWGGGDTVHTSANPAIGSDSGVAVVQVPASINVNTGDSPQSAAVGKAFTTPLAVTVKDANGVVINGASVVFTAPSTGAGGTFSNGTGTITVNTVSGVASAGTFTANGTAGGPYNVTATTGGQSTSFSLTNTQPQFVLTIGANPSAGGTVTPVSGGSYNQGAVVPLTATANQGYVFTGWTSSPDSVASASSATTSITMNAAENVTANFTAYATAVATATALSSSQNPSFTASPNNSVTFTATVNTGGSTPVTVGTVEFSNNGVDLTGCSAVSLSGSGQAQCIASFTSEGTPSIVATYSGYSSLAASYLTSNGNVSQEVDNHTVINGNQFCNTGAIGVPNATGPATPYPSHIFVSGLTGNVGKLTVQLNGLNSSDTQPTDLMLVGPTGAQIIPFAGVGNASTIGGVNITLDDAAADLLGSSTLTSGTYKPTSMTGGTSLVFPAPAPSASAANYAASDGSATFSSTFNNTTPNGTWSLYAMDSGGSGADSINGGWCVNITPAVAPAITSASSANVNLISPLSFTVTTTGSPTPSITEEGSLPTGVTFTDNGNGTATLSGTPSTGGTFPLVFTAANGAGTNAVQDFTLNVGTPPAITSASGTTFTAGTAGTFTVTTTGNPTPTISESGTLPTGVTFSGGVLSGTPTQSGTFSISFTASNGVTPNATQSFTLTVDQAPGITSASSTTFVTGTLNTFTVTTTGFPTPTISESGTLPTGVTFSSGILSGTPTQSGAFPISFTASNGIGTNATQSFTLTVNQAPAITSASSTTFVTGTSGTFTVTVTGNPSPTISETGTLPTGVSFSGGVLSGTPTQSGSFPISFTASNGVTPNATQSFTLTVDQVPAITSASSTTFVAGTLGTFTVTDTGFPTPTISETGTLPTGVSFSGGVLSGTPTQSGSFPISFTASNGVAPNATQSFTLTVNQAPAITSASSTTFVTGTSGTFTVTVTGNPTPTISETGTLPTGVTFSGGKLSGTPTQSGSFPITFTATNGVTPNARQSFTLTVDQAPAITSANHAAFTLGAASSFTVTTTGFPVPTSITESGSLPSGVTFTNNGNGTATLSGTPTTGGTFNIGLTASSGVSPNATQSFTLTASGPLVSIAPSTLAFGTVYLGTFTTKNVTVTNTGNTAMTLRDPLFSIAKGGDSSEFVVLNLCPPSLAAGKSCTIRVTFVAGPFFNPQTATLNIMDNVPGSPQQVSLTALVIDPIALPSLSSWNFGTQKESTSSASKAITLSNPGLTALAINSIAVSGANSSDFSETNNCPASLAPKGSCTINVTFKPTAKGPRSSSVVITDNAFNSPQRISLSGTGD
jgi:hypothetical protein